jgi:DMSO reductase anchor subunit
MAAKYLLIAPAVIFLVAGIWRLSVDRGKTGPQSQTWLIISLIFSAVDVWLWRVI